MVVLGLGRSLHRLGQLGDALDGAILATGLAGLVNQRQQAGLAQELIEAEAGKLLAGERLTAPGFKVLPQGRTLSKTAGQLHRDDHRFCHLGGFAVLRNLSFENLVGQLESQAKLGGPLFLAVPRHLLGSEIDKAE